ncbi:PilZ domain-containing protein [Sphingomonas canadensis]|uniref:PilZ domain-containing protein n=1 Tax=Sphingomonas canadensis TaxID=1219257 RepID=A0ABW3HD64_9SPHN|nr:PilZ domain-containing protein [Sphingomonas canadensis]MCW3837161.1 PilZ domain-containing protein [Sphingomonas canadensis]
MDSFAGHELTVVSLGSGVPRPPERRTEERATTLLRVGKLVVAGEQRLCMVRNLSSSGAMIRLYQPIPVGSAVMVEVTPEYPVPARVMWCQDDLAGIAFDTRIDVIAALRGEQAGGPYRRVARTPRMRVSRHARLCTDDAERGVLLCDISLNGAKVATDLALPVETEAAVFVDGLPPLAGRVRWARDGYVGMQFDVALKIDTLANWLGPDDAM